MNIPNKFQTAGGKVINVIVDDYLDKGTKFGEFNDASNIISITRKVKIDNEDFLQTDEDIERTFWHELGHVFQFYSGMDDDEMVAQAFSNFMYEFMHTKQ